MSYNKNLCGCFIIATAALLASEFFEKSHFTQGSEVTCFWCVLVGCLIVTLLQIYCWMYQWKKIKIGQ